MILFSLKKILLPVMKKWKFFYRIQHSYIYCMVQIIYLLSTRMDLCFALHKLVKFSSNPDKLQFQGLVHMLIYIRYNNNLGLKCYSKM